MHQRVQVNIPENQSDMSESLSALMDGEAGELELRRLLRGFDSKDGGAELLARWRRYHLVQASLHHEQGPQIRADLLPGIQARLAAEGTVHPQHARLGLRASGLVSRMAQGAVAASVAAMVLFGATQVDQHLRGDSQTSSGALVAEANETPLLPELGGEYNPSSLTRTVSMGAAERDRIQRAVQQFSGQAPGVLFNEVYTFPVQTGSDDQEAAGQ